MTSRILLILALFLNVNSLFALEGGNAAPDFSLVSYNGQKVTLSDFKGKPVVLEWFNPGCPFVMKHYRSHNMQNLQQKYKAQGVTWIIINSTNPNHLDFLDADKAAAFTKEHELSTSYFVPDPQGTVGKLYGAKTTPTMFVIDAAGKIAYSGAIDSERDLDADPTKSENYVAHALDNLLAGKAIVTAQTNSYGCSVKYAS